MSESPTPDRKATVLLLLVIAGCVDAVGVVELGQYFVSFMSGNTTRLGIALAYRDWAGALLPLGLVALFVAGVSSGTLIAERTVRASAGVVMLVEALLLAIACYGLASPRPMLGVVLLPVAMGIANIVPIRSGMVSPGVTYTTGTLVRLGIGLARLGRGATTGTVLYDLALWLALMLGSVAGAFGRLRIGTSVLLAPVAALLLLGLVAIVADGPRKKPGLAGR